MKVVAFCDASVDPKTRCAGIACVLLVKGKVFEHSFSLNSCQGSTDAEMKALSFSVEKAECYRPSGEQPFEVLIYSDCKPAIEMFMKRKSEGVSAQWVPSHKGAKSHAHLMNEHCDRLAKKQMRKLREPLMNNGK